MHTLGPTTWMGWEFIQTEPSGDMEVVSLRPKIW